MSARTAFDIPAFELDGKKYNARLCYTVAKHGVVKWAHTSSNVQREEKLAKANPFLEEAPVSYLQWLEDNERLGEREYYQKVLCASFGNGKMQKVFRAHLTEHLADKRELVRPAVPQNIFDDVQPRDDLGDDLGPPPPQASFTAASGNLGGGLGGGLGGRKKKKLPPTNEWGGGYTVVPRTLPPFAAPPQLLSPGGFGSGVGAGFGDGALFGSVFGAGFGDGDLFGLVTYDDMSGLTSPSRLVTADQLERVASEAHARGFASGAAAGSAHGLCKGMEIGASVASTEASKAVEGLLSKVSARLEGRFGDLENKFEEMREAGQAAAEAGQAAAEGTQAQVACVLAATHAVGNSVQAVSTGMQAVGQRVEAVGQRVEAVGQRVEDNIVVTTQMKMLAAANTASLQALAKATQESKRQELLASLAQLESACQEEAVQEARHAQLLAQFHHVEAVVSLHRAAGSTPATGTPAAGTPAAEAPVSLAPFPLEESTASAKHRESMASSAAASAKRFKTTGVAVGVAFGGSYRLRDENSTMPARFNAKRVPPGQPSGQPLSPSGKGNRGL